MTLFSFMDYFLYKLNNDASPSRGMFSLSVDLILNTIRSRHCLLLDSFRMLDFKRLNVFYWDAGVDLLEFRPSEVAFAVALSLCEKRRRLDVDEAVSSCAHIDQVIDYSDPI